MISSWGVLDKVRMGIINNDEVFWFCLKIQLIAFLVAFALYTLFGGGAFLFPNGICMLFDCHILLLDSFKFILTMVIVVASILYLLEIKMILTTLVIFLFSLVVFSARESNADVGEYGVLSLCFFAQFFAYLLKAVNSQSSLKNNRIQFCIQFFAAAYTLAGLSKLQASGIGWFTIDSPKISLEVMRINYSYLADTGNLYYVERANFITGFFFKYPLLLKVGLFLSLFIELFSFFMLFGGRIVYVYMVLLMLLHLFIFFSLDILFPIITFPLIFILFNPLYYILLVTYRFIKRASHSF